MEEYPLVLALGGLLPWLLTIFPILQVFQLSVGMQLVQNGIDALMQSCGRA